MDAQVFFPVAAGVLSISTAVLAVVANGWRRLAKDCQKRIELGHLHVRNLQRELSATYDANDKIERQAREISAELNKVNEQRARALEAARASNARKAAAKSNDAAARRLKTVSELSTTQLRPRAEVVAGAKREIA